MPRNKPYMQCCCLSKACTPLDREGRYHWKSNNRCCNLCRYSWSSRKHIQKGKLWCRLWRRACSPWHTMCRIGYPSKYCTPLGRSSRNHLIDSSRQNRIDRTCLICNLCICLNKHCILLLLKNTRRGRSSTMFRWRR
jgi:hypothetical protein